MPTHTAEGCSADITISWSDESIHPHPQSTNRWIRPLFIPSIGTRRRGMTNGVSVCWDRLAGKYRIWTGCQKGISRADLLHRLKKRSAYSSHKSRVISRYLMIIRLADIAYSDLKRPRPLPPWTRRYLR